MRISLFRAMMVIICMAIIGMAIPANASLTDWGGGILYDDFSGLYVFSDPTQFSNMTYDQQIAQIGLLNSTGSGSSPNHGAWRMATWDEYRSFYDNFYYNPEDVTQITPFGIFYPSIDWTSYRYFWRLDSQSLPGTHIAVHNDVTQYPNGVWGHEDSQSFFDFSDDAYPNLGALVVADPIPVPGTILLLGAGLIGLAGASRMKFMKRMDSRNCSPGI